METVEWVALALVVISGVAHIIGSTLDQVDPLSRKAARAVRALRELRKEIQGDEEPTRTKPGPPSVE
ncbi:hypothetical protein [Streptomyces naphthomycinicus]|uniref:hypothetical protein n=1 Tax=Streptomyces naphthomycinicus TaxID=2872625 RepID=UPI001CEC0E49|nr:hypothetical protein [Streptomyces sp. TML10]